MGAQSKSPSFKDLISVNEKIPIKRTSTLKNNRQQGQSDVRSTYSTSSGQPLGNSDTNIKLQNETRRNSKLQ
jgi:hypothetical protein